MSSTTRFATEEFWAVRYQSLEKEGYLLRPRYHPDWKPTWKLGESKRLRHEDSYLTFLKYVMDAVKLDENRKVVLKLITNKSELAILQNLVSIPDTRNHTVPLIDILRLRLKETEETYIVMPFLRRAFESPSFQRLGELLDAVHQFLIGLEFMHEQNISHRDACFGNLMVDASEFIPEHHFVKANTIDGFHSIRPRPRSSVAHIKYYFIDFGLSVRYPPGKIPIAMGKVGQERDVPEFKDEYQPYDPFKLDVYQLGTTIAKDVVAHYIGLDFLFPLTDHMMQADPRQRPSAKEARELFESLTAPCNMQHIICLRSDWIIERILAAIKNRIQRWPNCTKRLCYGVRPGFRQ
ncbi:kinase-like domain-containing protein [Mycena rebaudengoi]|nr:kinase-like domain-containing protein [Mycena rebaudengoi]